MCSTVPKWEIFEHTMHVDREIDNPFLEVDLCVILQHGECLYYADGFYDGCTDSRHLFRFRFAPDSEGEWSFRTASNLPELDRITGRFSCTQPVSRGGLAVNSQFPNWFFRQDGKPHWVVSDGWLPHPGFNNQSEYGDLTFDNPTEEEVKQFLDLLAKYKVNLVMEFYQSYARQDRITDNSFNWPWQMEDGENNKIIKDKFNLLYFQRLDRTLQFAKERGIFYGIELLFDTAAWRPLDWSHLPLNKENGGWLETCEDGTGFDSMFDLGNAEHVRYLSKYLDYLLARTAAYWNVYYQIGAECGNIAPQKENQFHQWYGYWGNYIARKTHAGKLISFGDTGECPSLVRHGRNNVITTQEHTTMDDFDLFCGNVNLFGERFWDYGRPVLIGEQDRYNNNKYEMERRGYWIALVSGFHMGRVDRHYDIAENGTLFESTLFQLEGDPAIYGYLNKMTQFIEESKVRYWRMSPSDSLIGCPNNIYCLAEPGIEYLIYFAKGGSSTLDLPSHPFRVAWYSPSAGTFEKCCIIQGAKETVFHCRPDGEDWALHIQLAL